MVSEMRSVKESGNVYTQPKDSTLRKYFRRYILPYMFMLKIPAITQIMLDRALKEQFKRLEPGIVLDVGSWDSPYKNCIPHTKYLRLDIDDTTKPDVVSDVHDIKCRPEVFDTVIVFGLGGVFTEIIKDVSMRVAPLTIKDCYDMINEIKGKKIFEGYRNIKPIKKERIVEVLMNLSKFAMNEKHIKEIDFNPVIFNEKHITVVDARMINNV